MLTLLPVPAGNERPWPASLITALTDNSDHPDAARIRRVRDVLAEARETIKRIGDECEAQAVKAALVEGVDSVLGVLDDTPANLTCVLDAWDLGRDARAWGDRLDQRRAVAAE